MAKSRRLPTVYTKGLGPTKERQRQNGGTVSEPIHEKSNSKTYTTRHRVLFENVLDAYLWYGVITEPQYEAGLRFGREYSRSVLKIKLYDRGLGSHGDWEMAAISAINGNRVLKEAWELLFPGQREVMVSICVENNKAGTGRKLQYLCRGLQLLAQHWRLA